jgi:hypothetical protein
MQNNRQQDEIKGLNQQIETLNRNREIEIEQLTETKEYEKRLESLNIETGKEEEEKDNKNG